jgi:hypothetical protein
MILDERRNCSHRVGDTATPCEPGCRCYCTGCFTERICEERNKFEEELKSTVQALGLTELELESAERDLAVARVALMRAADDMQEAVNYAPRWAKLKCSLQGNVDAVRRTIAIIDAGRSFCAKCGLRLKQDPDSCDCCRVGF